MTRRVVESNDLKQRATAAIKDTDYVGQLRYRVLSWLSGGLCFTQAEVERACAKLEEIKR